MQRLVLLRVVVFAGLPSECMPGDSSTSVGDMVGDAPMGNYLARK